MKYIIRSRKERKGSNRKRGLGNDWSIRFLGLLKGAGVAKVEEIVDAIRVYPNGTVLVLRRQRRFRMLALICHSSLLRPASPLFLSMTWNRNFANAVCAFSSLFSSQIFFFFLKPRPGVVNDCFFFLLTIYPIILSIFLVQK